MKNTKNQNVEHSVSRLFSVPTLKSLLSGKKPKVVTEAIEILKSEGLLNKLATYADVYSVSYKLLVKGYRNEYIYKNAIANNVLLGIHNLNTAFMLQEFRASNCKVDVVVLNGTSNVYEIKSEFDTMERLERQITAYQKVFDKVHVIVSKSQVSKVEKYINESVGILELTSRGKKDSIKTIRPATSMKDYVDPEVIFDSLRRDEYIFIIKKYFGSVPEVPNTLMYRECKKLFVTIPPADAHGYMVEILKKRGAKKSVKEFIDNVPSEFVAMALSPKITKKEMDAFWALLEQKI
ncbi:hypothetical protein BIY24_14495 [Halobacteriovorax marinus]|uniref:sce7726 family protein n=1 Tax=Halobacteriovorax marinus TaxID=97084 RepID=UPI000BC33793|nr:sce7726 family protein [Halobacteriovorax marinus]ATH09108.1 hypothetical protein BIY24_14495 [Halobacteriovorax marinus]